MPEAELAAAWSAEQLSEFATLASSFDSEAAAARGTVERLSEALDAEVVALVAGRNVIAVVGYPEGEAPLDEIVAAASGQSHMLTIPGARRFPPIAVAMEHPAGGTLVLARSWDLGLSRAETGVLRGIARVAAITMRMLHLLAQERERQALLQAHADAQSALRRVATLVARGVDEATILGAVADEVGRLASADVVQIFRYDADAGAVRVAGTATSGFEMAIGERLAIGGHDVITTVHQTGRPARIDGAGPVTGGATALNQRPGVRSVSGSPIVVEDRLWGVVVASTTGATPMPAEAERRISDFTDLVATAIANAQARAELAASRARVVMASDATRRRIERNLHDGVQQRLVTVALELRGAIDMAASQPEERDRLVRIEQGLQELLEEIREISRGLHPAILSEAGLVPALKSLARRSGLPVKLDLRYGERLPASIEVAAYYVISEALTNTTKHGRASAARVMVEAADRQLRLEISDDGVGGADPARGSGLFGLTDRVEALGGTVAVSSPPGGGTTIVAKLPIR